MKVSKTLDKTMFAYFCCLISLVFRSLRVPAGIGVLLFGRKQMMSRGSGWCTHPPGSQLQLFDHSNLPAPAAQISCCKIGSAGRDAGSGRTVRYLLRRPYMCHWAKGICSSEIIHFKNAMEGKGESAEMRRMIGTWQRVWSSTCNWPAEHMFNGLVSLTQQGALGQIDEIFF